MATSGSYDHNETVDGILKESLGLIGVHSPSETLDPNESNDARRTLNFMLKAWQGEYWGLWLKKEYSLYLQKATFSYSLGPTGDHSAISSIKTELAAVAASGATSLIIDSTTGFGDTFDRNGIMTSSTPSGSGTLTLNGALVTDSIAILPSQRKMLIYSDNDESGDTYGITGKTAAGVAVTETLTGPNTTTVYSVNTYKTISSITISGAATGNVEIGCVGDHIGIELDGGTVQWTYFKTALSTTAQIVTALSGAAAIDNHVYSYTTKAQRPLDIYEVRLVKSDGTEQSLSDPVSRNEYMALTNKDSPGSPNQVYFDPQRTNAVIKTWPVCNNVKEYIKFTGRYPIQDVDDLTDDIDIPQEWLEAVAWNLAPRLAPKYGKPIDPMIILLAKEFKETAEGFDAEKASTFIQVV